MAKYNVNLSDFNRICQIITRFYDSLHNVVSFPKILAFYLDFIQHCYILLTFSFALGPFKSLPQNFGLFQNGSIFQNFRLGDGKSLKSESNIWSTIYINIYLFIIDTVTHTAPSIILSWPRQNWWFVYICLLALLAFKVFTKSWFFNEIKYKMQLNILFFLKNNFFACMNKWFLEIIPNLKHI